MNAAMASAISRHALTSVDQVGPITLPEARAKRAYVPPMSARSRRLMGTSHRVGADRARPRPYSSALPDGSSRDHLGHAGRAHLQRQWVVTSPILSGPLSRLSLILVNSGQSLGVGPIAIVNGRHRRPQWLCSDLLPYRL